MNQALAFLLLLALAALIGCPIAALLGAYQVAVGALYLALILGVPSYCVLLARHINPKEEDQ
jgi:inner membrane protein involved in colicin E2 resistance